jgi:tight adherence protein B
VSAALRRCLAAVVRRPAARLVVLGVGAAGVLALVVGGPVLAVVAAVYTALGGRALLRRATGRRARAERQVAIAKLTGLAADLRAGLPPSGEQFAPGRIGRLITSVWRLAERTGAPAADLVERIEADARAADRAAASASAQAAGARATALLLAGLPVGGIGLGLAIGADPTAVLLHTPLGGACAIGAVLLQGGGLIWSERLTAGAVRLTTEPEPDTAGAVALAVEAERLAAGASRSAAGSSR